MMFAELKEKYESYKASYEEALESNNWDNQDCYRILMADAIADMWEYFPEETEDYVYGER